jgi:peroxiredoxin
MDVSLCNSVQINNTFVFCPTSVVQRLKYMTAFSEIKTNTGESIQTISESKMVMLVFLRHFGCQFCRHAIDEISKIRAKLLQGGTEIVFVHMATHELADEYFQKFNLSGVQHVSDPECGLYADLGLVKGSTTQLFGLQSWYRGFTLISKYGSEIGSQLGDSFQMPGVFVIQNGKIKNSFIHRIVSDRPDYFKLIESCTV